MATDGTIKGVLTGVRRGRRTAHGGAVSGSIERGRCRRRRSGGAGETRVWHQRRWRGSERQRECGERRWQRNGAV
jgi:hypothetical protein